MVKQLSVEVVTSIYLDVFQSIDRRLENEFANTLTMSLVTETWNLCTHLKDNIHEEVVYEFDRNSTDEGSLGESSE